jgi:hypothetical protein
MHPFSASEAITPAFQRTKTVLFQPFQIGRSWKLSATAYLALMGSLFLPTPLATLLPHPHGTRPGPVLLQLFLPVFALLGSALMFLFFYIGVRLQFARFDIVLRGEKKIAPLWRRYAPFTGRWLGLKLSLSAVFFVLLGVPLGVVLPRILAKLQFTPGQRPAPALLLDLFLVEALFCFAFFFLMFCSSLLDDFILPSIALEGVPLGEAFRRFTRLLRSEPGQLLFYAVFKALLALGCGIAMEVGILVTEFFLAIPLFLVGFLGWLLLHHLGPAGHILMATGVILLGLAFASILIYVSIGFIGAVMLFLQAYALYFLAGRYPMLGDLLDPPTPGLAYPTPPPPAPAPQFPFLSPDPDHPTA